MEIQTLVNGRFRKLLKTPSFDFCTIEKKFLKNNSIATMLYKQLSAYGNMIVRGCPIPKGIGYVKNFTMDGSQISSMVPEGIYHIFSIMETLESDVKVKLLRSALILKVSKN